MNIVIVGAGRIGSHAIELTTREQKHDVIVVEKDLETAEAVAEEYDCLMINDDATSREVLTEASVPEADALISTTDDDSVNLTVMMLGRELGASSLVSAVRDPGHLSLFRELGVTVIQNPQRLTAEYLVHSIQRPSIRDFMRLGEGAEIFEIPITVNAPVAGETLEEANAEGLIPGETIVVAIDRDGELLIPEGETVIKRGDLVTVFSREGATSQVVTPFTGE
jgi:trk system potassium uptake protein TrkA